MEFTIDRFKSAHAGSYEAALQEIKAGRKQSHWMWYIFPQFKGLGHSTMAMYYEIQSKEEAAVYYRTVRCLYAQGSEWIYSRRLENLKGENYGIYN